MATVHSSSGKSWIEAVRRRLRIYWHHYEHLYLQKQCHTNARAK